MDQALDEKEVEVVLLERLEGSYLAWWITTVDDDMSKTDYENMVEQLSTMTIDQLIRLFKDIDNLNTLERIFKCVDWCIDNFGQKAIRRKNCTAIVFDEIPGIDFSKLPTPIPIVNNGVVYQTKVKSFTISNLNNPDSWDKEQEETDYASRYNDHKSDERTPY